MDFLKQQARRGLEWGGGGTLAVTAFLAVYREGAETSLMYQALLGSQGHDPGRPPRPGRRPGPRPGDPGGDRRRWSGPPASGCRCATFFKFSGLFLFALAVVFAGNGVFELQNAGILLTTPLAWLGSGLPPGRALSQRPGRLGPGAAAGRVPSLAWVVIPRASLGEPAAAPDETASPRFRQRRNHDAAARMSRRDDRDEDTWPCLSAGSARSWSS